MGRAREVSCRSARARERDPSRGRARCETRGFREHLSHGHRLPALGRGSRRRERRSLARCDRLLVSTGTAAPVQSRRRQWSISDTEGDRSGAGSRRGRDGRGRRRSARAARRARRRSARARTRRRRRRRDGLELPLPASGPGLEPFQAGGASLDSARFRERARRLGRPASRKARPDHARRSRFLQRTPRELPVDRTVDQALSRSGSVAGDIWRECSSSRACSCCSCSGGAARRSPQPAGRARRPARRRSPGRGGLDPAGGDVGPGRAPRRFVRRGVDLHQRLQQCRRNGPGVLAPLSRPRTLRPPPLAPDADLMDAGAFRKLARPPGRPRHSDRSGRGNCRGAHPRSAPSPASCQAGPDRPAAASLRRRSARQPGVRAWPCSFPTESSPRSGSSESFSC